MLKAGILGSRDGGMSRVPILQSHEPAHGGMPQVETAVPERDLGLKHLVGLPPPGLLELSQSPKGRSEIVMQSEMGRRARTGLQQDAGRLTRLLRQLGYVVGETLGVPDFETKGQFCLKLSLAHPAPSTYCLSPAYPRMRSSPTIPQVCAA